MLVEPLVRLLAEELEREMQPRFVDPRQLGRALAQRGRGRGNLAPHLGRKINREKEPHASPSSGLTLPTR